MNLLLTIIAVIIGNLITIAIMFMVMMIKNMREDKE
jgi:hypothetical protein|tara:strand:- start:599 stop:706 length:108 start_codon:yes stop_codon:yes gene_type:complete